MKLIRKEFSKDNKLDNNNSRAKGAAAIGTGLVGNTVFGIKYRLGSDRNRLQGEENVVNKLKDLAKKNKINIDEVTDLGIGGPAYVRKNNTIYTAGTKDAGSLAHELGHAHYSGKGWTKGRKFGQAAHKAYFGTGGMLNFTGVSPLAGIAAGTHSGIKKANLEKEGKKEGFINKHQAWLTPLLVSSPGLVSEALASRKGLHLMRKSGASKELLKVAKKDLKNAFGTYGTLSLANAGVGELSRGIAYNAKKKSNSQKNNKNHEVD